MPDPQIELSPAELESVKTGVSAMKTCIANFCDEYADSLPDRDLTNIESFKIKEMVARPIKMAIAEDLKRIARSLRQSVDP
jgi:hypothetical protein